MANSSYGHYVRLVTDEEDEHLRRMREKYGPRFYACSSKGCEESVTHFVGWRYVTGKAGRTRTTERGRCAPHTRSFAEAHGIQMPDDSTEEN